MNGFQKLIQSKTFFPVLVSLALMLVLIFLPTGYEGALSYQNADRVPALVLSTDESDIYDTGLVRTGDQRCRVRILGGQFAGTEADAVNRLSGSLAQDKLFSAGEKAFVVVSHSGDAITTVYMTDHFRLGKEAVLAGLFLLLLLIFARGTGLRAILSFIDTILLMWKVLVPSLLNGYNPICVSLGLVMVLTALILMLIYGLANQTISYAQFDEQYVAAYKENGTSFEDAMKDVEKLFGLKLSGEETDRLVLTDYEVQRLRAAYDLAMSDTSSDDYTQEQYVLYGTYNPFSVTVTHILNNKSGVDFTSYSHTGLPVAVFADGNGADAFTGYYDNTEIYQKMASLVGVQ